MKRPLKKSVVQELDRVMREYVSMLRDQPSLRTSGDHRVLCINLPDGQLWSVLFQNGQLTTDVHTSLPDCCYYDRSAVYEAIDEERQYQIDKWGDKPQSLAGFLLILQKEIDEAIDGWMKNSTGRDAPLHEVLQVAAVAVACLERYGHEGITINVNDIPQQ